jgi:hypothetical protein
VLTLTKTLAQLDSDVNDAQVRWLGDGASQLTHLLLEADEIELLVGPTINPAHQNPDLPFGMGLKQHTATLIAEALERRGKTVTLHIL